ncbi:MAG: transcription elongation factor GreB [Bordetella sp.]|jgi:transcription elongation factor GreB
MQAPNYITPAGYRRLLSEMQQLIKVERPAVTETVRWAASNGDRSENGDYIYGKRRLREIDRRIRFLTKRLEQAQVVDPIVHRGSDQIFFGATVVFLRNDQAEETIRIVGQDEVDPAQRWVSWVSPIAKTLLKAQEGDCLQLKTPSGADLIEVLSVSYCDE